MLVTNLSSRISSRYPDTKCPKHRSNPVQADANLLVHFVQMPSVIIQSDSAVQGVGIMARLISVNISSGGIPKLPVPRGQVTFEGLVGDGRDHAKHIKPSRAICTLDLEIIEQLREEGFPVNPGDLGENLTLSGCRDWQIVPGARLRFGGGVEIEISEARRPCFVLDALHPDLKHVTVGRLGWMARVTKTGWIIPGEEVELILAAPNPNQEVAAQ
jgi:MOSC domain-containing protein YiiM